MNIGTIVWSQVLWLGLCGAAAPVASQESTTERDPGVLVEDARDALGRWVETRRVISQEQRDWTLGKEVLTDRIGILEREIAAIRERIDQAEASITEADDKRAELVAANEAVKATTTRLEGEVGKLESRTGELLGRVPDPIRQRVEPLSQQFPDGTAETSLSLSQRFQNVIGVLNAINKFQREVSVSSEVRELGDGTSAEVTALYLGIGQGFYVTASGDRAGVGSGAEGEWKWTTKSEAGAAIQKAIAIFKNEDVASFVQLPVRIQ